MDTFNFIQKLFFRIGGGQKAHIKTVFPEHIERILVNVFEKENIDLIFWE